MSASGTNWSTREDRILTVLRPYLTTTEIYLVFQLLALQRSKEAISRRARRLDITFIDFGEPPLEELLTEEKEAVENVLDGRLQSLGAIKPPHLQTPAEKSKVSTAIRIVTEEMREKLEEKRAEVPHTVSTSTKRAKGPGESLCLVLSDFHIGRKIIDPESKEIIYNVDIGVERIRSIPTKILSTLPKRLDKYDEMVIMLCGDMIDGEDIFPGHAQQIQQVAEEQTATTVKALWNMTRDLANIFPLVRISTVPGNHGRAGASNWDNVLYRQLEILIDELGDPNVLIRNRYEKFNVVNIKGHKGLLRHKAPAQADTAAARARFGGWYDIHKFDFVAYGHLHHWGVFTWNGKTILRNGSLMGADDYAEELAVSDTPCQLMFGITEEILPTAIVPIGF